MKEEHSAEPWEVVGASCLTKFATEPDPNSTVQLFRDSLRNLFRLTGALQVATEANAARIVACVNFVAGITTEALVLMVQSGFPTLTYLCEENQRLRAENKSLTAERGQKCEHCGSNRIYSGPPDCPGCGAPQCCQTCCKITKLEDKVSTFTAERDEARRLVTSNAMTAIANAGLDAQESLASLNARLKKLNQQWIALRAENDRLKSYFELFKKVLTIAEQNILALERLKAALAESDFRLCQQAPFVWWVTEYGLNALAAYGVADRENCDGAKELNKLRAILQTLSEWKDDPTCIHGKRSSEPCEDCYESRPVKEQSNPATLAQSDGKAGGV